MDCLSTFKRLFVWLACLLHLGCARESTPTRTVTVDWNKLADLYRAVPLDVDAWGFVDYQKCDSTLFSGMVSAGGKQVDLVAAEYEPGRWWRRPVDYPECHEFEGSRSTISRDMLLGVYLHAWTYKDRAMLERLWDFGEQNFWKMGDGRYGGADTLMNTAMISTLAQMIYALGGEDHFISRNLPVTWGITEDNPKYYVNRLTALHLIIRREAYGHLSDSAEEVLEKMARLWPDNPLFLYAAGRRTEAGRQLEKGWEIASYEPRVPAGIHSDHEYIFEWTFVAGKLLGERDEP